VVKGYKTVKDAILFAIDVSESMLRQPPPSDSKKTDTNSPLMAALKCAYHLMQQRIISDPKDMMGVLLYNTEASKFHNENENTRGGWSFPHCYLLTNLDVPEAEDVKALRSLVEDDSDVGRAILKPAKEPISMHHVLFCANQIFQNNAPNFTSRRLFIVTDNDDPHASDKAFRTSAAVRAKDLYDLGVVIELFPISSSSHTFDTKLFYDDIVYRSNPSDPDAIAYSPAALTDSQPDGLKTGSTDGLTLLQSLLSTIASKSTPKRTLFSSVPLELAPNLRISVKGYLLYKRQAPVRSSYIYLGSERPQIAVGKITQQSDESERKLEKFEVRKAYTFGGEQILFTPEEIKLLRNFGDPVIRVLGFKPASMLQLWANTKQSTFLYPSEDDFVGSTRVFSALHQKLLKSKLMAVTWFIARRNAAPVIAALMPTLPAPKTDAKTNLTGASATECPQGLHLIPLPFADDIRKNPDMPGLPPIAPDSLIDAMSPIIRKCENR
jgi:ATP-dependent DNA helicase 2 subunit 1